jgi:hypothetical protein
MDENEQIKAPVPPTQFVVKTDPYEGLSDLAPKDDPDIPMNGPAEDWTGDPSEENAGGSKDLTTVAKEVLAGDWGLGQEQRVALANAGYDPNEVKAETVRVLNDKG